MRVAAPDEHQAKGEVEVLPAESADLSAPRSGHHREPDQQSPVGIDCPCLAEDESSLFGSWWIWLRLCGRRCICEGCFVDAEVPPSHCPLEGSTDDEVDLSHGAAAQRPTSVPCTRP